MNLLKSAFACLVAVLLAIPAAAKTVDQYGVVVFTQADVNAGGITPGDTPGFPASILVSGSYRLASPLTLTSLKNGIVISAPAVTLDLGGFKVSGAAVGRNGIVTNQVDTTISNGMVRGFTVNGIEASGSSYLTVNDVHVTNNGSYGLGGGGNFVKVTNSVFAGNDASGISCGLGCLIEGNIVANNGADGIFLFQGGLALGNVATGNLHAIRGNDSGYGNNMITQNYPDAIVGSIAPLHPNSCKPACPVPAP